MKSKFFGPGATLGGGTTYRSNATYAAAVLADSPVSYWRLGETSGTSAADSKGANTGTYTGTPVTDYTLGQTSAIQDGNKAVSFTAIAGFVSVNDDNTLDLADVFTLEAWVKKATDNNSMAIISKGAGAYLMEFNASNQLYLEKYGIAAVVSSTTTVTGTGWHHVAITKNAATVKQYIDGVDVTGVVTNSTFVDNAVALNIGRRQVPDHFWSGSIDEVAVYSTPLSAARIAAHYAAA